MAEPALELISISCPRCAGSLESRAGEPVLECRHCRAPYLIAGSGEGFERRYFPEKVDRLRAVGAATRWLLDCADTPDDIVAAAFVDARLLYLPIWEARAYLVGWEFGRRYRTRRESRRVGESEVIDLELVDETVEAGFFDERRQYREAVDLRALGVGRPHITGRDFSHPFLPGEMEEEAAVLEPQGDRERMQQDARSSFLQPPTGTLQRDGRYFLMRESLALLYYPLWHLRYRYRERQYDVMVDGRNAVIHAAHAPAENNRRLAYLLASYAALALLLALAVYLWRSGGILAPVGPYLGLLAFVLGAGVHWRFELLGEVEYHEPFAS